MAKQLVCQRYIYKIHSARLRNNGWSLVMPIGDAIKNGEVISLADSQVLRWIDEINGIKDADELAKEIRLKIKSIRGQPNSAENKRKLRKLYAELNRLQFKPDYMTLIIDRVSDYRRACKGFSINGVNYTRLLGTNGGIKNSTIVFVSDRVADELRRRIENGRDPDKPLVTAKLESYKALTCSASTPVSFPDGVLVVNDLETTFLADVMYMTDENCYEPFVEERKDEQITLDASDGCGMMLPCLAERWSEELCLGFTAGAFNTRMAWEKGVVVAFDFRKFAEEAAGGRTVVKDAWGDDVDVRNVELVLTTSMVKLWDSYDSCASYLRNSRENGYTFGITKNAPETLENERAVNYQYIQPLDLDDDDLEELIRPTSDEFSDVLGGDWRKSALFMLGSGLNERNVGLLEDGVMKAVMIDKRMLEDPYVRNIIYQTIKNRIDEAKVGSVKVHGNYSIATGDPYALCQKMFGMKVTGLLSAGEIYSQYWADAGAKKVACFRSPMTTHRNIRLHTPVDNDAARYWFGNIKTCTVFNAWDTTMIACNGMDYDGDIVFLTDNDVMIRNIKELPALMCAQRKAEKKVSATEDFVKSNIDSFGSDIGRTTNWATSMYEVRSRFDKDSEEYKTLSYRINCSQLFQQNAIDKTKGIICKPMPKEWHDYHSLKNIEDTKKRDFYRRIVAGKKPYFMRYIYPALNKEYNTYVTNAGKNSLKRFGKTIEELRGMKPEELSEAEAEYLENYDFYMPVGIGDCVVNRICRKFEQRFDGIVRRFSADSKFDYSIMRSEDAEYTDSEFYKVKKLCSEYAKQLRTFLSFQRYERMDKAGADAEMEAMKNELLKECRTVCPNEKILCNIILDLCYKKKATKSFAWAMCGSTIIDNLLEKNDRTISFPVLDDNGDFTYCGKRYSLKTKKLGECFDF